MSPSPTDKLVADLQKEINKGRVLAIVGTGTSIGATGRHPYASWIGLLESGVEHCLSFAQLNGLTSWRSWTRSLDRCNRTRETVRLIVKTFGEL